MLLRHPPSLTPRQTQYIDRIANTLPLDRREDFRNRVMRHLAGMPTIHAVEAAVGAALALIPSDDV